MVIELELNEAKIIGSVKILPGPHQDDSPDPNLGFATPIETALIMGRLKIGGGEIDCVIEKYPYFASNLAVRISTLPKL